MREVEKCLPPMPSEISQMQNEPGRGLVWIMALACGLGVANLYYMQPLLALIAHNFTVSDSSVGFIATLSQMGYALGLLLIAPLGDSVSRRSLILGSLMAAIVALAAIASAPSIAFLAVASLLMGSTTIVPQIIIPFAAGLAHPQVRGRVVGTIMSGLLTGVVLARVVSGFVAAHWGWRAIYWVAVVLMLLLLLLLYLRLPRERLSRKTSYARLLRSLWSLIVHEPILREVCLFGAFTFGAFQLFWVTATFFLSSVYQFQSDVIGLFGLVGIFGALTASFVGKHADRGFPRMITGMMMGTTLLSYLLFWLAGRWLWSMILGVILLDVGSQGTQISNQARLYSLPVETHSRLHTVYMFTYFLGGTLGAALGTAAWSIAHWPGVCTLGVLFMLLALGAYLLRERTAVRLEVTKE